MALHRFDRTGIQTTTGAQGFLKFVSPADGVLAKENSRLLLFIDVGLKTALNKCVAFKKFNGIEAVIYDRGFWFLWLVVAILGVVLGMLRSDVTMSAPPV